jgi:methyl-accepting chemotaxis protein
MKSLKIKHKVILLAIIPLVAAIVIVMLMVRAKLMDLGEAQVESIRHEVIAAKEEALKNYIGMALTAIKPYLSDSPNSADQENIKAILRAISFGKEKDGYIFVYDQSGTNVVMGPKPALEGKNLIDLKDPNGVQVIKELIDRANEGGGFLTYDWAKPSIGQDAPKLSYATLLKETNWMVGTGFYIDDVDALMKVEQDKIAKEITHTLMIIAVIGLIVVAVGAITALWVAGRISKPLNDAASALMDISQGEGDLTRRLKVEADDEIGQLAEGFNRFADKTQAMVVSLKRGVEELSRFTARLTEVVENTDKDVQKQRVETQQTAAAVHEMAATAQEVASNAGGAAGAADQADKATADGRVVVNDTIQALEQLYQDVNQASEVIARLDDDADRIGSVVNVIKEIADQTNLLALNAAIEAARAGEQGRGFSVVADEVRTLANRTQESTQEIQSMIEQLLSGARDAVSVMQTSRKQGEATVTRASEAKHALDTISGSVSTINAMNTQIASAAEEQTAVADEISKSVQQIADIAEHTARNAHALSGTSKEMNDLEGSLKRIVNQFKVE